MLRIKSVLEVLYDCIILLLCFCIIFRLLFSFLKYGCQKEGKNLLDLFPLSSLVFASWYVELGALVIVFSLFKKFKEWLWRGEVVSCK